MVIDNVYLLLLRSGLSFCAAWGLKVQKLDILIRHLTTTDCQGWQSRFQSLRCPASDITISMQQLTFSYSLRCVRPSRVCLTLFCLFRRRILELSFLYAQEFLLSRSSSSSLGGIQEYIDKNYDQKWALHVIALIKVLPSTSALNDWVRSAEQDEEVKVSHRVAAAYATTELPQQQ